MITGKLLRAPGGVLSSVGGSGSKMSSSFYLVVDEQGSYKMYPQVNVTPGGKVEVIQDRFFWHATELLEAKRPPKEVQQWAKEQS